MIRFLKLSNVRTFSKAELEFKPGVNLIIGQNGAGKTTVLEAIGFLAYGKFLSIAQDSLAIKKGEQAARLEFELEGEEASRIEIGFSAKEKIIRRDGQPTPVSLLIGQVAQVFFNPETVELVFGSPALRRREIDVVLTQADRNFVRDILSFKKVLKERNALLRSIKNRRASVEELEFWDERFSGLARKIYQTRLELLNFYNQKISKVFASLARREGELQLKYLPSVNYEQFDEHMVARRDLDIESGSTSIGPHRDDFAFMVDGRSMREGASRGEQRLAAVAFKGVASEFLLGVGKRPTIVLDDVFSELDFSRQEAVANALAIFNIDQVFISATDQESIPSSLKENSNIIRLES